MNDLIRHTPTTAVDSIFRNEIEAAKTSGNYDGFVDAVEKVVAFHELPFSMDRLTVVCAGLQELWMTPEQAMQAARVLMIDPDFISRMRYCPKDRLHCFLTSTDFKEALDKLPRADVPYSEDEVKRFVNEMNLPRSEFQRVCVSEDGKDFEYITNG